MFSYYITTLGAGDARCYTPKKGMVMEIVNGRDPKEKLMEDLLAVASQKKWHDTPLGKILLMILGVAITGLIAAYLIFVFGWC